MSTTPRTQALWMKHHAFSTEEEATEALCDFRDHGNALETELAAASQAYDCAMAIHGTVLEDLAAEREKVRGMRWKTSATSKTAHRFAREKPNGKRLWTMQTPPSPRRRRGANEHAHRHTHLRGTLVRRV